MKPVSVVLLSLPAASALLLSAPLRAQCARPSPLLARMDDKPVSYEEYLRARNSGEVSGGSVDEVTDQLKEFMKYDLDFDGGDSGGGVVGDGNTDLEDQHNSPSIVRGGFGHAAAAGGGVNVGRGAVKSATDSRVASAGKNYFGRSTGYAEQKIAEITQKDVESGKMDCVRAQQLENWQNQRAIAKQNRKMGQGVVFGEDTTSGTDGVSQRDLAKHLDTMRNTAAARLDGEEWQEVTAADVEEVEATFSVNARAGGVSLTEILVSNLYNTFAPYQCDFTTDSPTEFSVSPSAGSMNRRSGEPIKLTVRFQPTAYSEPLLGTLVFETEDFKKVYKFIGST